MQNRPRRPLFTAHPENNTANITSAIGMEETAGRLRARRHSLFTQTVMWITGLVCVAFLLGSLAQAWSNSQLMQKVQISQHKLQQLQDQHRHLTQATDHYQDPSVIESEARQQLGYIRPGDQPVVIISSSNQGQAHTQQQTNVVNQQGFWQQWWQTFFGE